MITFRRAVTITLVGNEYIYLKTGKNFRLQYPFKLRDCYER
jgi:hypothetical protein